MKYDFYFLYFFPVLRTSNRKFSNNVDLRKQDFLSTESETFPKKSLHMHLFIPHLKDPFSQVNVITKILNSIVFKYFQFFEYFNDVK